MANKNFTVKNGLEVGGQEVISSSGVITSAALGGQVLGTSASPSFANITTAGYLRGPASFVIDPAAHGDDTGTVVIAGNLQVDGTQTTINSTTMTVDDLNLTLASGAANAAAANGAGINVDISGATNPSLVYGSSNDDWTFNKNLNVTGNIGVTGTVDGVDIAARDAILTSTTTTAGAALPKAGGTMTGNLTVQTLVGINKAVNSAVGLSVGSDAASATSYGLEVTNNSSNTRFLVDGLGSQRFYGSDNAETARFTDGKLGIGVTTPTELLHIKNPSNSWNEYAKIRIGTETSDIYASEIGFHRGTTNDNDRGFFIDGGGAGTQHFKVLHTGNVGIGTASPKARVHIGTLTGGNGTAQEQLRLSGDFTATNSGALLRFTNQHDSGTNPNVGEYNLAGIKAFDYRSDWGGGIALQTAPNTAYGGTLTDRLVIDPEGLVGIGVSGNLLAKLHIGGAPIGNAGALVFLRNSTATSSNTSFGGVHFSSSPGTDYSIGKANVNSATSLSFRNGNTGASLMELSSAGDLTVAGNIAMTTGAANVNGRRIFMGGTSGTTFGLAYDSNNPNYGIFYTEGSPDAVNISPNGSATAGVMTILGNGNVGIGTSSPDYHLDVESTSNATIRIHAGTNSSASLRLKNDAQDWDVNTQTDDNFAVFNQTSSTQPFTIRPAGQVQTPLNPAFRARAKTGQVYASGWQHVLYDESVTTRGTGYASSRFTAPVDGWYQFNAQWTATNNADVDGTFSFWINGSASNLAASVSMPNTGANYDGHSISGCCYLAATHYVQVHRYSTVSTTTRTSNPYGGWFSGFLIG